MNEQEFYGLIMLRGHHISFFLSYILWKYAPPAWDIFADFTPRYGELYIKNKKALFEYLYAHPDRNILIVENIPDNLCDGGCLKRNEDCFRQTRHDQQAAECYGLKMWSAYPAEYFINEIHTKQKIGKPIP